jgi:shikimate dehydrogenase
MALQPDIDDASKPSYGFVGLPRPAHRNAVTIGLIGRGISKSLSPVMHREEGERQGLDYAYHLIDFDVLELNDDALEAIVKSLEAFGYRGANVTHPFKQDVIAHLTDVAPEAAAIGAVNTIVFGNGRRVGHNTDCWGYAESFRQGLKGAGMGSVVQFGAGGAGAAVAHALMQLGAGQLDIVDADPRRAQVLADKLTTQFGRSVIAVSDVGAALARAQGVVNTTPVGMSKYPGTPFPMHMLRKDQWVSDVIYFPRETELTTGARALGCRVLPGMGMAIYQAVKAFALFTGKQPDADAMTHTFEANA